MQSNQKFKTIINNTQNKFYKSTPNKSNPVKSNSNKPKISKQTEHQSIVKNIKHQTNQNTNTITNLNQTITTGKTSNNHPSTSK